jgi:DNA-directed RNA polymerase specialized sigma24 family protein
MDSDLARVGSHYPNDSEEVADLLGISRWSVRTHAERGLAKLKRALEVKIDV